MEESKVYLVHVYLRHEYDEVRSAHSTKDGAEAEVEQIKKSEPFYDEVYVAEMPVRP